MLNNDPKRMTTVRSDKLEFANGRGNRLAAILDRPAGSEPLAYGIFAHCFTCNKNYKGIRHVCHALAQQGVAVLRFDFTGLGESGGDFSETGFSSNVEDIIAAASFLGRDYSSPHLLIGHSLGGAAALAAAPRIASIKAVVTIAAPSSPAHVADHLASHREQLEKTGEAIIRIGEVDYLIKKHLVDDLSAYPLDELMAGMDRALLVLHSPLDKTVGIQHASSIFSMAHHPKSFVSLDRADHLLTSEADASYAGAVIAAWAKPYLAP